MASQPVVHNENVHRSRSLARLIVTTVIVVVVSEAAFVAWTVHERGLFEYIGLDYRGSRAAGEAILEHGFAAAYEPLLLEDAQRQVFNRYTRGSHRHGLPFYVVPAPYPPPFTLAFVPSTWLPPVPGFLAWTVFHALVLALYQLRLATAFRIEKPGWLIVAVCLSLPAFVHLIMGQISVWIVLFFGEALIAFDHDRHVRSGIWLGLLVCKPQVLVLIVPALVLARRWRVVIAMMASITVVIGLPIAFAGGWIGPYFEGILSTAGSTGTVMNTFPSSMTNWRAFFLNASRFTHPLVAGGAAAAAMLATAIAGLSCARGLRGDDKHFARIGWLGLAAATCAVSWHAHVHQSLILVPPLFAVVATRPRLKDAATLSLLGTSELFLLAAFTLGFGVAHDVLGLTILAALVALTAACALTMLTATATPGSSPPTIREGGVTDSS